MSATTWLPVVGYEGRYEVSDTGEIRSLLGAEPRLLVGFFNHGGYRRVLLYDGSGHRSKVSVHHVVTAAFLGPRPSHLWTRHLDGNPRNNAASNLRYGTPQENNRDTVRHGHHRGLPTPDSRGQANGRARLTETDVLAMRALPRPRPVTELAARYGVGVATVEQAIRGYTWSHLPTGGAR